MFLKTLAIWFSGFSLNTCSIIICRRRGVSLLELDPLKDIIQMKIPAIPYYIPDLLLLLMGFVVIIIYFGQEIFKPEISFNTTHIDNTLHIHSYILFSRAVMCQLTLYPTCMPLESSFLKEPSNNIVKVYNFFFHGTHDLMFSGHTSVAIALRYMSSKLIEDIYIFDFWMYLIAFTLIISKQHYTIDVIVAFFVFEFWKNYLGYD